MSGGLEASATERSPIPVFGSKKNLSGLFDVSLKI
jgi:hypothetical protein